MNTITKVDIQTDDPVIPALHPGAAFPKPLGLPEFLDTLDAERTPPANILPITAPQLLRKAVEVMEARAAEYDKPDGERSVQAVVTALNAILGRNALTEAEGYLFMTLLKSVRLFSADKYHADSGLDGVAYAALTAEAKARQK